MRQSPQVIFTTAHDTHAVRAFEANAVDFLLKPIAPERLAAALDKVQTRRGPIMDRVFVRDRERCWLVAISDIVLLESEGNYTRVYFGNEKPLILRSLAQLEERLDPSLFFRASRRHLINLRAVTALEPGVADNLVATLAGRHEVEISRRQSLDLRERLSL